jgi:hypothetical protein
MTTGKNIFRVPGSIKITTSTVPPNLVDPTANASIKNRFVLVGDNQYFVDADGAAIQVSGGSSGLVFFDNFDPNTVGTLFSKAPSLTNPSAELSQKVGFTYIGSDYSSWIWNGTDQYEIIDQIDKVKVKNPTASALLKLKVVYISGASGGVPEVTYASNATELTSSKTLGVIQTNIAGNSTGWVVEAGEMRGNTSAWTAGTALWLGTNGDLTATKPVAPAHMVFIGTVLEQGSNGRILVKVQNGFELGELHDVDTTDAVLGDTLQLDTVDNVWRPTNNVNIPVWVQARSYRAGDARRWTDGEVYYANGAILSGTAFTIGTTGATWRRLNAVEVTDEFYATAGQTAFTLSAAPRGFIGKFVSGSRVPNAAFTVSGTSVTYNPLGNNNNVLTLGQRVNFDYVA